MSSKALRQMYKEHHICIHCGQNDAMPGRVSCAECLAKDLERHTQAYENLSGETKAAYLQKRNERQREKRKRLVAQGICIICLKRPMSKGYRSCIECRTKDAQKRARNSKEYRRTSGTCAYCDEPPIPGKRCCPKHYASRIVAITKCRQSEGFRLSQIEQKKRISVFWREMEWERNQRMKQPQCIHP